jgi:hypothetical protein
MTQQETIEMVRQAGFSIADGIVTGGVTDVKRFAKLVAEREREACAKICDEFCYGSTKILVEKAIRARGQA